MLANAAITSGYQSTVANSSALQLFPSGNLKLHKEPIVLVHGWGTNSQIWQSLPQVLSQHYHVYTLDLPGFGLSPALDQYSEQSLIDWLHAQLPGRCYLLGLSLGGMLCRAYAAAYPEQVRGLITLSANLRFVADKQYPLAMPKADFEAFSASWDRDSQLCLNRFAGLQSQGDVQQRQLIRQLRSMSFDVDPEGGGSLLSLLATLDGTQHVQQINCPSLAIFGGQDCLVPAAAAELLPDSHTTVVIDKAAHLPHLSCQSQVVTEICEFIDSQLYSLDKHRIAQSFGRAAKNYDAAATVQKWSGQQLINRLKDDMSPQTVMDLGCGTGLQSVQLKQQFPRARVTGVDFSAGMLAYARTSHADKPVDWLCCDAENLAVQDSSQTLVFSNFALQWCVDLQQAVAEIYRVLEPGGRFYFAVPGPQTLWELRDAWAQIDEDVHINRFLQSSQWHSALQCAGFGKIDLFNTAKIEYHPSVKDLMLNLKTVGAHNNNSGKSKHLTGKSQFKRLYSDYEQYRTSCGKIPATWDIIFGSAVKET